MFIETFPDVIPNTFTFMETFPNVIFGHQELGPRVLLVHLSDFRVW